MDRIGVRETVIDAIKEILLVALVMEDSELRRIEEAAGIEAVSLDEVAPVFAAIRKIEPAGAGAERSIRSVDAAGGLGDALPERVVATITRLVLPPYSAGGAPLMTSMD